MVKAPSKASVKSKKSKRPGSAPSPIQEKAQSKTELPPIQENNLSEIIVTIDCYQNMVPHYPSSFIFARCWYLNKEAGETAKVVMTDDPSISINHQFKIKIDTKSSKDLDQSVSNPVIIKIFQFPNIESSLLVKDSTRSESDKLILERTASSIESAVSLYEALTGDIVEKVDFVTSPSREKKLKSKKSKSEKKGKKGSKTSRGSEEKHSKRSSKDSKSSKKSTGKRDSKTSSKKGASKESPTTGVDAQETEIGVCIVDLLPLIFGKSTFTQFIQIMTPELFFDDRMTRYLQKPGISVTVSIEKPIDLVCKPNLLYLTLESIYNTPTIMNEEMEYEVCILLPSLDSAQQAHLITSGLYTNVASKLEYKRWPEIERDYFNITNYKIDPDLDVIKNCVGNVDLKKIFSTDKPRIDFNCVKRIILLKEGFLALYDHIKKFQRIVLEIHAFKRKANIKQTQKSKERSKENVTTQDVKDVKSNYLHLMAVVDLSSLLYPGVTKIRIAVPLTTFHEQEALQYAGLENSYFFPYPLETITVSKQESKTKTEKPRSKSKSSKGSKGSKGSKKSKKEKKSVKDEENLNMNDKLPAEPAPEPPPKPSVKVYSEEGHPTFIVLEIELTEPLVQTRKIEDLHGNLKDMVLQKSQVPKVILDNQLAQEFCRNILKEIVNDINKKYVTYVEEKNLCHCEKQADFITYLRRCGLYKNFVYSIMHIASLISQFRLNSLEEKKQHTLVEEIFIYLMKEMNQVLHKMTVTNSNLAHTTKNAIDDLLLYAKEAEEIGNSYLAERYYVERLQHSYHNPDPWFDYAVFKLQHNEQEKAFMCLQEALSRKSYHRNSLLLSGILLAEKNRLHEAELCLLLLMVQEPRWVEGWTVLYLFYKEINNAGGMDFAQEMTMKYLNGPQSLIDKFTETDDLAWTASVCPKTPFFRASVILLKMRVFSWVENALAYELTEAGIVHYMLAVICYYKKNYEHALEHLERARFFHGSDYAVVSLTGHCYLALGKEKEARQEYLHVLESYERPEDIRLVYLNCAKITDNLEEARKLLLLACKHSPTPYTWMCCGVIYFKKHDFISAEECFSESIVLDNSVADCWGYLSLINLKMKRSNEAEICYGIALKNNLENKHLMDQINEEFEKLKQKGVQLF